MVHEGEVIGILSVGLDQRAIALRWLGLTSIFFSFSVGWEWGCLDERVVVDMEKEWRRYLYFCF